MFSPADYHRRVPREPLANLRFRRSLLRQALAQPERQPAMWEMCRRDILFYINAFVWQFNPRKKGAEVGPFITWDFQEEAVRLTLECIEEGRDLTTEKSREMGASWLFLIVLEWLWHFHPMKKFLVISRNQEAVQSSSSDSLFWKLDFIHQHTPGWLMPRRRRRKMYFGNLDNGSSITGEASTGKAGVGGRATAMLIDEFAQIEEDFEVLHRTSDTTDCRIFNSTHLGLEKAFYGLTRRPDMRVLQMHWSQHPDKRKGAYRVRDNRVEVLDKQYAYPLDFKYVMDGSPTGGPHPGLRSPWYDAQCLRKGSSRAVAMDLDIDPSGSVSRFFDGLLVMQLKEKWAQPPWWEGAVVFDRETGRPEKLDSFKGGPLKLWCHLSTRGVPVEAGYAIGCDCAAGTGATNSCASIVNAWTGQKVGEYADAQILPDRFAELVVALCRLFRRGEEGAALAWETPGPGLVFGRRVIELGYRNIYYRTNEQKLYDKGPSDLPGWHATPDSRRVALEEYRRALSTGQFVNPSWHALDELLYFRYVKGGHVEHTGAGGGDDPSGARVNHGDRVIADALAWKMAQRFMTPRREETEEPPHPLSLAARRQAAEDRSRREKAWA